MRLTVVDSGIRSCRIVTENFHDVDLAALGPLTVVALVLRHHPDSGPKTLSLWNSCAYYYLTVLEVCLVLGIDLTGSVIRIAVNICL